MRADEVAAVADALPDDYTLMNADGSAPNSDGIAPLGSGGSSVVFRALYRGRLQKAIKVMIPRDDLLKDVSIDRFNESFANELTILASLNHEGISHLSDMGTINLNGTPCPFLAMDFIEGEDLLSFAARPEVSGADILSCLAQVLEAMVYLHAQEVMHCDLKEENIAVHPRLATGVNPDYRAVILDLGSGRMMTRSADDKEYVFFYSTKDYVVPGLVPYLSNRSGNRILRGELRRFFPRQDLYSLGIVIANILANTAARASLEDHLGRSGVKALNDFKSRLAEPDAHDHPLKSATEALDVFGRLGENAISPLASTALNAYGNSGIVVPGPNRRIALSEALQNIVDHPLVQRLQSQRQLGLLDYVLPGGRYTRLVHTLNTFAFTRDAILRQLDDWRFRLRVDRHDLEIALATSLLGSVGKYHFSHMFEDFLGPENSSSPASQQILNVNQVRDSIMGQSVQPLGDTLSAVVDRHGRTLEELLVEATGVGWSAALALHDRPKDEVQGFLAGLASGPIDTDKLAYLKDDSRYSALPFGRGVEPQAIFESLRVADHEDWKRRGEERRCVGVREKALAHVEQAVSARYWNIQSGYWHRTNRALQSMVKFQIACLLRANRLRFSEFLVETMHLDTGGALTWLNNKFIAAENAGDLPDGTVNPMAELLRSDRYIYKRLVTISPKSQVPSRSADQAIWQALHNVSPLGDEAITRDVANVISAVLGDRPMRPGEVLLDMPRSRRDVAGGRVLVYADEPGSELVGDLMRGASPTLRGFEQAFDLYAKRLRIFIHPQLAAELGDRFEEAHSDVLDMLRDRYAREAIR